MSEYDEVSCDFIERVKEDIVSVPAEREKIDLLRDDPVPTGTDVSLTCEEERHGVISTTALLILNFDVTLE